MFNMNGTSNEARQIFKVVNVLEQMLFVIFSLEKQDLILGYP